MKIKAMYPNGNIGKKWVYVLVNFEANNKHKKRKKKNKFAIIMTVSLQLHANLLT